MYLQEDAIMPRHRIDAEEKLISVGRELLLSDDPRAFNMRSVAKQCGISLGTVYRYFGSTELLLRSIIKNDWNKFIFKLRDSIDEDAPPEESARILYFYLREFKGLYKKDPLCRIQGLEDRDTYEETIKELCSVTRLPRFVVEVLYAMSDLQGISYNRIESDIKKLL